MSWFHNLAFRWKLILPIALLAVLMLSITITGISLIKSLGSNVHQLADEYLPGLDYLLQADRDLYQALSSERSMIFLDTNTEAFKAIAADHEENIVQARGRATKFFQVTRSSEARKRQQEFLTLFAKWAETTREIKRQRSEGGRIGRRTAIELSFNEGAEQFNRMRQVIDELSEQVQKDVKVAVADAHATTQSSQITLVGALLAGLSVCVLVVLLFPAMVTRLLDRVVNAMDLASGNGDLTLRLEVDRTDELGHLAGTLNQFLEKLKDSIALLAAASTQVRDFANQMSQMSSQSLDMADKQHTSTDMVATAINEMSTTVQEIANSASSAAEAARQADEDAKQGGAQVESSSSSIRDLAKDVEQAAEVIHVLEKESERVGSVLDVIGGLAEQTNLLALNAAIEAARAGDQGRGFAVVADEVRTLAGRTQHSTTEIREMIESLQGGARRAVSVMDAGREKAQLSVERSEAAGQSLGEITKAITSISDMNMQIASATEEQSAASEEINRNVTEINLISDHNSQTASKIAQASSVLSKHAEELDKIVQNFKI